MSHYADLRRGATSHYDRAWHQANPMRLPNEVWDVIVVGAGVAAVSYTHLTLPTILRV